LRHALYHGKLLFIAKATDSAERGPKYTPTEASRAAQVKHLARLKAMERYPGCTFTSPDNLAKHILSSAILDLLVKAEVVADYGTPEQLKQVTEAAVKGATGPLLDRITEISKTLGVTEDAAKTLLKIVGEDPSIPGDKLAEALTKVAGDYKRLQAQVAALNPDNPAARALVDEASPRSTPDTLNALTSCCAKRRRRRSQLRGRRASSRRRRRRPKTRRCWALRVRLPPRATSR
jgi:hypothetical protein